MNKNTDLYNNMLGFKHIKDSQVRISLNLVASRILEKVDRQFMTVEQERVFYSELILWLVKVSIAGGSIEAKDRVIESIEKAFPEEFDGEY